MTFIWYRIFCRHFITKWDLQLCCKVESKREDIICENWVDFFPISAFHNVVRILKIEFKAICDRNNVSEEQLDFLAAPSYKKTSCCWVAFLQDDINVLNKWFKRRLHPWMMLRISLDFFLNSFIPLEKMLKISWNASLIQSTKFSVK